MKPLNLVRASLRSIGRATGLAVLLALLSGSGLAARAGDFNLARDFDATNNPGGVWTHGWETTLGGTFTPVTFVGRGYADNGMPFDAWSIQQYVLPAFYHYPLSNPQAGTAAGGQGNYPPGTVVCVAGNDDTPQNFAVIRFTAPSNGTYQVTVTARPYLNGPLSGDVDFHVLGNGVSLLSRFLLPTERTGFTNTLMLAAGATLDLAVGRGADGQISGSGLNIEAVITPETVAVPFITQQPRSTLAKVGTRVSLGVVASSPALVEYQWYFNGEAISGATASTLVLNTVRARDAGTYSVRASNAAGTVWTAAVLSVKR